MPIIKRSDGVQFVTQSYREPLEKQSLSLLKRNIRLLAQKHGEYICLIKRDNGGFEAVFSRDLGFLLGESVWYYLQRPRNLILCENLPEEDSVLLVVVKAGTVYIDAKVSYSSLAEDLAFLSTSTEKYDVFVYGDVPLAKAGSAVSEKDSIILEKESVNSFTVLPESVLPRLAMQHEFQLQSLALILNSSFLKNKYIAPITTIVISAVLIFFIREMFFSAPVSVDVPKVQEVASIDGYELYNKSLMTSAPGKLLIELGNVMALYSRLGGWDVVSLNFANGIYKAQVKTSIGNAQQLQILTKKYGININGDVNGGEANLSINTSVAHRAMPSRIYELSKVVNLFTEKMQLVVSRDGITLGSVNSYGTTKSLDATINFNSFAPSTFALIGKLVANLPLSVSSIALTNEQGLYSGTIKVTIWGN